MTASSLTTMVTVTGAAALAPLLADLFRRWARVPSVVLEIALGILVGPALLGWAHENDVVSAVADFGLSLLMFLAGYEIDFKRVRGDPVRLAVTGWAVSLGLGVAAGLVLGGGGLTGLVVGLALTTTALGTTLPIVRDAGLLPTPFGTRVLAVGAIGEFGPIVVVALLLTSDDPVHTSVLMAVFAVIAGLGAWAATKPVPARVARLLQGTLRTSVQFAVRLVMLIVVGMLWIADSFGLDVLLGAFAAGIIVRLAVSAAGDEHAEVVESKLEAIGFGLPIPGVRHFFLREWRNRKRVGGEGGSHGCSQYGDCHAVYA